MKTCYYCKLVDSDVSLPMEDCIPKKAHCFGCCAKARRNPNKFLEIKDWKKHMEALTDAGRE